jgi:hypothetical protein
LKLNHNQQTAFSDIWGILKVSLPGPALDTRQR